VIVKERTTRRYKKELSSS